MIDLSHLKSMQTKTVISALFKLFFVVVVLGLCCVPSLVAASGGYSSLQCMTTLQWLLLLSTGIRREHFSSGSQELIDSVVVAPRL